jgi:hypothetical protein
MKKSLLPFAALIVLTGFGLQLGQIRTLKQEVKLLKEQVSSAELMTRPESRDPHQDDIVAEDRKALQNRVANLERAVARFAQGNGRTGNRPLEEEIAGSEQQFLNVSAGEADRLKALRTLRRGSHLSDEVVGQTLALLQSSTNINSRRELLRQLEGVTNAAIKRPLVALLGEAGDAGLREQAVNLLRPFVDDPDVEAKLWDVALNEPNTRLRDQAREALARGPATPERVQQLLGRASNPNASLDERLVSFRALRLSKSHTPELVSDLGTLAQNTTDPIARAKLFKAFNGLTDESLMLPLVNGLQDADPVVRQNAANALSSYGDPRVQQWLSHLIQNDTDPAVKREAHAALEHSQRMNRKLGN